jgi:heat shock protein HtpX
MNNIKTLFLLVTLTLILVWAGAALGGKQGMTMALVFALVLNFFAYWFSDKIVLKMYGAKAVSEAEAPELYGIVRRLIQKAEMPMPKVYIINEEQPNAFATGRNPKHAAVAVTKGIMRILSHEELQGVIGHELAHVQHRDILISTIAATIAGAISYLAQMAQWAMIFGNRGDNEEGGNPIAALIMMIVGPIAALIVQMAISRSREYAICSRRRRRKTCRKSEISCRSTEKAPLGISENTDECQSRNIPYVYSQPIIRWWTIETFQYTSSYRGENSKARIDEPLI